MRINTVLFGILFLLLVAVFFRVRREYFTGDASTPTTVAELKAATGVTDAQFNNVVDAFIRFMSGENVPPFPADSPENRLGLAVLALSMGGEATRPLINELQRIATARAAVIVPPAANNPFEATKRINMTPQYPSGPKDMPGSQYFKEINRLIYSDY